MLGASHAELQTLRNKLKEVAGVARYKGAELCLVRSCPYLEDRGKLPNSVSPLRRLRKQWSRT